MGKIMFWKDFELIEHIFKNYKFYNKSWQIDMVYKLMKRDDGVRVSTKEENGFIDIEYNNKMGEYKAKLLIEYLSQNKEFWKAFFSFSKCSKIVVSYEDTTLDSEIHIQNHPYNIDILNLFSQIPDLKNRRFIKYRLDKNENLLGDKDIFDFLRGVILNHLLKENKVSFFEFLDLNDGTVDWCLDEKIIVDICFKKGWFGWLYSYAIGEDIDNIKQCIFNMLYEEYSLKFFNELISKQVSFLSDYTKKNQDDFLEKNIFGLGKFFEKEYPLVISSYKLENVDIEKNIYSQEDIVKLVIEFLNEIDRTGNLSAEFRKGLEDDKILIYNPKDEQSRQMVQNKIPGFGIFADRAECRYGFNENGLTYLYVTVPLTYTLDDVRTIVHEFFHYYSVKNNKNYKNSSDLLGEFPSIYFEEKTKEFLLKKGYPESDISVNFRVLDAIRNFNVVRPIITYICKYIENGYLSEEVLNKFISDTINLIIDDCTKKNMTNEEIENELKLYGFVGGIDNIRKNIIWGLISTLLTWKRSIFELSPYLFGTIFTRNANVNECSTEDILNICEGKIDNINEIMELVGIDLAEYGFGAEERGRL